MPAAPSEVRVDRRPVLVAACLAVAVAAAVLHAPVLGWSLFGDDFEYARRAHEAAFRPAALLRPLGDLPRPLVVASFLLDWHLWPRSARGAHLTTLGLHLAAALALLACGRRLGLSIPSAGAAALLWACSPFAEETASWASARADTLLLLGWLGAVLAWPAPGRGWTPVRITVAASALAASATAKETWVGAVVLVAVLEGTRTRWSSRSTLAWTGAVGLAAAAYATLRLGLAPPAPGYLDWGAGVLAKLPRLLSAFFALEELEPIVAGPGWRGLLAAGLALLGVVLGWRGRNRAALVGAALALAGVVPILAVAYLPMRYAAVPYAGFLLAVAAVAERGFTGFAPGLRQIARAGLVVVAAAVLASHVTAVRRNQADGERLSQAHRRLIEEAATVAGRLPVGAPIAVLRAENHNPLAEIAAAPVGRLRLLYVRRDDPYGLVDAGALLDWARDHRGTLVTTRPDWRARWPGRPGWILVHEHGGFRLDPRRVADLTSAAEAWIRAGGRLQVIEVEELP